MQASVPENTRALLDSNSWVPAFARRFREGEATAEVFCDKVLDEVYQLAVTASPMYKEI